MKKIMIGLKVDPDLKDKLQELADDDTRSLSGFVLNAVLHYMKDHHGIDWKKYKKSI